MLTALPSLLDYLHYTAHFFGPEVHDHRRDPVVSHRGAICYMLLRAHGGVLSPLRIQGQGLLHAHQIKEIDDTPHLSKKVGRSAVLADFPEDTLRQGIHRQHQAAGENHDLKTQRFELCHWDERGLAML